LFVDTDLYEALEMETDRMGQISENFLKIEERVERAAEKSGVDNITLVLVSKTKPSQNVQEAVLSGGRVFGENRVQEAKKKIGEVKGDDLKWHMIGHLQKNKVNQALKLFDMIQSLDSIELAKIMDNAAQRLDIPVVNCLVEVNIGREESKGGVEPGEIFEMLAKLEFCSRLKVRGLMAIPPFELNPDSSRKYFQEMRKIWEKTAALKLPNVSMDFLSMGMSHDFDVAIEEGANMVRVGRAIFGERNK